MPKIAVGQPGEEPPKSPRRDELMTQAGEGHKFRIGAVTALPCVVARDMTPRRPSTVSVRRGDFHPGNQIAPAASRGSPLGARSLGGCRKIHSRLGSIGVLTTNAFIEVPNEPRLSHDLRGVGIARNRRGLRSGPGNLLPPGPTPRQRPDAREKRTA